MDPYVKPAIMLKKLQRIYFLRFFSCLLLATLGSLVVSRLGDTYQFSAIAIQIVSYLSIGIVLVLLPIAQALPQRRINLIARGNPLPQLIAQYSKAILLRFVFIHVAVVISIVGFVIAKNTDMLLLVAIGLLFFTLNRPSRFKVAKDLNLTPENEALLTEL